jgi:hypothetical protein
MTLPEGDVAAAEQMSFSGGLPLAREGEAITGLAVRPDVDTVGFVVPVTLTSASATLEITAKGARVRFRAESNDAETAQLDAAWLTDRVNQALTVDLAFTELNILGPYTFVAAGRYVESTVLFTPDEAEWVVGMARSFMPGG